LENHEVVDAAVDADGDAEREVTWFANLQKKQKY